MDIFNNRAISGYEEICSYGPSWWPEYREMDAVYRFAGWTLDLMALWLEKIVLNQFPAYADEETIAILEKILKLEPAPGDSLEERRRTVALYFPENGNFRASTIQSLIQTYSGCSSDIWWEDGILQIRIYLDDETAFFPEKISGIVSRRMPAHIAAFYRYRETFFQLEEEVSDKLGLRLPFGGWARMLDGSFLLNGVHLLDAEITSESAEFAIIRNSEREVL